MASLRVILVSNTPDIGDYLVKKVNHKYPDAEVFYWRNLSFSVDYERYYVRSEPPIQNTEFFNFWLINQRIDIAKKYKSPYFYVIEFYNHDFLNDILHLLSDFKNCQYDFVVTSDEKKLLKLIRNNIER